MIKKPTVTASNKVLITVPHQGAPIVSCNDAVIVDKTKKTVILEIDLTSKYCVVEATTGVTREVPGIYISVTPETNRVFGTKRSNSTKIEFPHYKGWSVYLSNISRYTLKICLRKK